MEMGGGEAQEVPDGNGGGVLEPPIMQRVMGVPDGNGGGHNKGGGGGLEPPMMWLLMGVPHGTGGGAK